MKGSRFILAVALLLIVSVIPMMFTDDSQADGEVARIGNTYYTSLNDALDAASSGDVVIVFDGCRLTSDATLPAGVTLLLPYSDGHGDVDMDGFEYGPDPTSSGGHRKKADDKLCVTHLYIDKSARLTVYGNIVIGGVISERFTYDYQGHTYGEHGRIVLEGELVMKNGSSMDCYGYVTGSGTMTAENGSSVREPLIVTDFVGGDRMKELYDAKQSPFDRYSFSNIESRLNMDYGSRLIGIFNVYADGSMMSTDVNIIGIDGGGHSTSLIELNQGSHASIAYDKNTYVKSDWSSNIWSDIGKTSVTIDGGATFNMLKVTYNDKYLDLSDIAFSIPYNFSYTLNNGLYEMNADLRILPGASITISDDATLKVNSTLLMFNGLEDIRYREKYYPGSDLLQQYGFSTHGSLYVNGYLRVSEGAAVLGIIESTGGEGIVTVDPSVKAYKDWYVNYGTGGSLTIRRLSLWVYSDNSLLALEPGYQYPLSAGLSLSTGFDYYYNGSSVHKSITRTFEGIYISPSQQPTLSMTVGIDNHPLNNADVSISMGTYTVHLDYDRGMYITYSAADGEYDIRISYPGGVLDGGKVTIKDGRGVADVSMYTVSFVSEDVTVGEYIVRYDSTMTPPSPPAREGYTMNGWYENGLIFTSKSKITHTATLGALWGQDTAEHRNVTPDKFPIAINAATEDVSAFFSEGSVKLFIAIEGVSAEGIMSITFEESEDEYSFIIESDVIDRDVMKTVTVPCDIMRTGLRVECRDGYDVSDVRIDNASQTVTFASQGSSFKIVYDPDPEPFDSNSQFFIIAIVISTFVIVIVIVVIAVIMVRKK